MKWSVEDGAVSTLSELCWIKMVDITVLVICKMTRVTPIHPTQMKIAAVTSASLI